MSVSSLLVVLNALRLSEFKQPVSGEKRAHSSPLPAHR
jgi:hypothetical protein